MKHHSSCSCCYSLYSNPDTGRNALHETPMRPKVHLLGFHVWMEARWYPDQSLRVCFEGGGLERESWNMKNQSDKTSVWNTSFACVCTWVHCRWCAAHSRFGFTALALKGLLFLSTQTWLLYPGGVRLSGAFCPRLRPIFTKTPPDLGFFNSSASLTTSPGPCPANPDFSCVWRGWSHQTP